MGVQSVSVDLGDRSYQVLVGESLLGALGQHVQPLGLGKKCAIVTDSNVGALYAKTAQKSLADAGYSAEIVTVPSGEESKCMHVASDVCELMIAHRMDRSSFVVALGGGVVGDLAGFVSAIYYRGIPFVQIPTTIVSLVDSAVGGKTGVNAVGGKNLIGAFHQPKLVLADVSTLATLPLREFNQGFAEIIKHGIIRDRSMLEGLDQLDLNNLAPLIARNVEIKASIVSQDEHETKGFRALLNFGHTVGHGIENAAGYGTYFHGEAISLGIVAAAHLSMQKAGLSPEEFDLILRNLKRFKLPTQLPGTISTEAIMNSLLADKKFAQGSVRFVLTPGLGEAFVSKDVTLEEIRGAIEKLR
jgi:3-dehydroquinate synthase